MSNVWLIGLGKMSFEYSKVLEYLDVDFISVGRSKINKSFKKYHKNIYENGLSSFLKLQKSPAKYAIIAVNIEELYDVCFKLINFNVKNILLEKPGSLNINDLRKLYNASKKKKIKIHIAYNRRYYSSVIHIKEFYLKRYKLTSANFDFTEIKERFLKKFPKKIIHNWLVCNSSHLIDLVFYLIGNPKYIRCKNYNPKFVESKKSVFIGMGESNKGIPFTYHANWSSPGNWNLHLMSSKFKIILNPLEQVKVQKLGAFDSTFCDIDYKDDLNFKPGLKKMLEDFFFHRSKIKLPTLFEQIKNFKYFNKIG